MAEKAIEQANPEKKTFFQTLDANAAVRALDSKANGLTPEEAQARLCRYGPNALKAKKKAGPIEMFIEQFKDFMILLLMAAAAISFYLGEQIDAIAILAIVLLNAVIGFTQEYRAEKAIEALKKLAAPKARVVRAGVESRIDAAELVPGDVVILEEGDKIPADCRLLEAISLEADEASLTGESLPAKKEADARVDAKAAVNDWKNCLFLGTAVTRGRGRAVVFATGMQTQIGSIATMVSAETDEDTPLQKKLDSMGKQLGIAALAICGLIFAVGVLRGGTPVMEMFLISVALAVAAIPEGLPAVVTISLAIGVQRMARKHSIIRRLPAVEALGSATVICTDKTGTLTKSELTARKFFVNGEFVDVKGEGYSLAGEFLQKGKPVSPLKNKDLFELMQIGVLCNNASLSFNGSGEKASASITGDPTEACLLVAAEKAGIDYKDAQAQNAFVSEIPFDSKRKMMTVVRKTGGGKGSQLTAFTKGAPEMVLEKSAFVLDGGKERKITAKDKQAFLKANKEMASAALRVLGFAYRSVSVGEAKKPDPESVEEKLVFVGLAGMIDPPRQEAKDAIAACHEAGIRVIMVTGDNPYTAQAIGKELGLEGSGKAGVINGVELNDMSDAELTKAVRDTVVFARVAPEHKLRIVKALKANGEVVAMTGDGVNDAPAIKASDIGVAMGITGTDVAKEASDMVITDDNFASIERAVEEGRIVYDNILKSVRFLLSCNIGELFTIFFAIMAGLPSPLTPLQILWMNIVTDSPPALALAMNPADPDVMRRKPRDPKKNILSRAFLIEMAWVGALLTLVVLGIFFADLNGYLPGEEAKAGTMAFSVIVLFQKFFAFEAGCPRNKTILESGLLRNKWLLAAFAFGLGTQLLITEWQPAQAIFQTTTLNAFDWILVLALASTALVLPEIAKVLKGETRKEAAP